MATNYCAYTGKVVKVDLTTKTVSEYPWTDKQRKLFVGGKAMAAKILYDNILNKIDPLSAENILVVATCPLNATPAPSSARFNISGISPLTGLCTSSNCGGTFGIKLKKSGYDALVITGKSEEKIYLNVTRDKIEFLPADNVWGLECGAAQQQFKPTAGKIVIGPAGENLVKYACIVSDERVAGRGGLGAVMGFKNLKAVVAEGYEKIPLYNEKKFMLRVKKWIKTLKAHPLTGSQLPRMGTAGLVVPMQFRHILATKNFSRGQYEHYDKISGELLAERYLVKNRGCTTCPIQCARTVNVGGKIVKGPELETLGLLGANILNDDMESILRWNYELDELGMDSISAAGTLAFAMELNEKGMWDNGLSFGKTDNISQTWHDIAHRATPVADLLAEGSRILSKKFGGEDFAINSKGMELSAYEPRSSVGQGLGYAVSNRGGCHLNAGYLVLIEALGLTINPYTPAGKASLTVVFQNLMEAVSIGGNCLFTAYAVLPSFLISRPNFWLTKLVNKVLPHIGAILYVVCRHPTLLAINLPFLVPHPVAINNATGMKLNIGQFIRLGERGYNTERALNERLGVSQKDDSLPRRLTDVLQDPNNPQSKVPLELMKKRYYKCRGWDANGLPTKKLLRRLKIDD